MSRDGRALLIGGVLLTVLGTALLFGLRVATDIVHFLPAGQNADRVQLARELASGELSRTMVLVVDAPDAERAAAASVVFERELRAEPAVLASLQRLVAGSSPAVEDALWQTYSRHRLSFLATDADAARARLTPDALAASIAELRRKLASPMSNLISRLAPEDPLLIMQELFERLLGGNRDGLTLVDGRFLTGDERGAVLFLTTTVPTSNASRMRPLLAGLDAAFARTNDRFGGELALHQSGTHLFALAAEASIKSDIQRVGIGSALGLTTLFLVLFRSLRLILLVLPILTAGFLTGSVACLLLFGSVHGLTLAFGAALIGVSVDYGVHFHCHHLHVGGAPRRVLASIWPGLGLGALTTITGFLALLASSFPGLRQLAVFAIFGIAAAALSTWLFLPAIAANRQRTPRLTDELARRLHDLWFAPTRRRRWLAAPLLLVAAVAAFGLGKLQFNDNLADLNRIDATIAAQDRAVQDRVVSFEKGRLVVATGASEELALQANDAIAEALARQRELGNVDGFRSVAPMLPSSGRQRAVAEAVRGVADLWPRVERALTDQQFRAELFEPFRQSLLRDPPDPLTYDALAATPLDVLVAPFRFTWSGGAGYVTLLQGLHDEPAVRAALRDIEGADLIDIAGTLSDAYGSYRERLLQLWLVGLGAVLLLVAARHRRWRPTLIAYAPAVLGAAGTAGALGLLGMQANMLSLVALLMVVSMGVDYGVFLAEHRDDVAARRSTLLAILLAGTSTILGFGLLAFSSQPPLFHIGTTAAIGVSLCMLLAPCVASLLLPRAR